MTASQLRPHSISYRGLSQIKPTKEMVKTKIKTKRMIRLRYVLLLFAGLAHFHGSDRPIRVYGYSKVRFRGCLSIKEANEMLVQTTPVEVDSVKSTIISPFIPL